MPPGGSPGPCSPGRTARRWPMTCCCRAGPFRRGPQAVPQKWGCRRIPGGHCDNGVWGALTYARSCRAQESEHQHRDCISLDRWPCRSGSDAGYCRRSGVTTRNCSECPVRERFGNSCRASPGPIAEQVLESKSYIRLGWRPTGWRWNRGGAPSKRSRTKLALAIGSACAERFYAPWATPQEYATRRAPRIGADRPFASMVPPPQGARPP